jgi:AcrR family transcriptional regulator
LQYYLIWPSLARGDSTGYTSPVVKQPRSLRADQVMQTRAALIAAARVRFGQHGFSETSVDDIARAARVTTGALYHHFPTKTALFEAVFEQLHEESLAQAAAAAAGGQDDLDRLARGADAFLDSVLDPEVQRIIIVDAPAVLGPQRFTELDERYAFSAIVELLEGARVAGLIRTQDPETLARLLIGAMTRGALLIANSPTPRSTRDAVSVSLREVLAGLAHY